MIGALVKRVFGSANDRFIRSLQKTVDRINALEPSVAALSDADLQGRTAEFRQRLAKGESLDSLLPEAFATVREAGKRVLGQRHFNVQLMGGMVLHQGRIAEMKTGEGKTLVATLAAYLNALPGKGVHVVTVNDYLAKRDADWMGRLYRFLGMSVGCIVNGLNDEERRAAYSADITYGTNNEFGFDYLRDNMKFRLDAMVHRPFSYAVVDEVDSILIDEARTPLIISGPAEDSSELYRRLDAIIPGLSPPHWEKDEKARSVTLTDAGVEKVEELTQAAGLMTEGGLYDVNNITVLHHVTQALRAHKLFSRDTDYIVKDGKVLIIDEFTGRIMDGRRYSEGLHQALEAKEKVDVQLENQTLASITFQNYFRLYPKLAGMTGTAMTEAGEFQEIYKLEVIEVPTHRDMIRKDYDDEVYRTKQEKVKALIDQIEECHKRGQPVLVGTVSIEKSEELAAALKKRGVPHSVLNARYHEQEAFIIAEAGIPGAVTIATNMAGRGTDIQLGGNREMREWRDLDGLAEGPEREARRREINQDIDKKKAEALAAGGLYVIGTERHESRRIDNQLRGRTGRQGDPGASKFFLSLEDDLMRIFGSERMDLVLRKLGLKEGEAIIHPWINKALEKAQQKVEARNFEIRKQLLKFDDVMNDQRKVIYDQRREIMQANDVSDTIEAMRHEALEKLVARCIPSNSYAEQWALDDLHAGTMRLTGLDLPIKDWAREEGIADAEILERIEAAAARKMAEKAANFGPEIMRSAEKSLLLQLLDQSWKDHLLQLDHLRQGISLRAYAQRDPLNEYKAEAFSLFEALLAGLRETVTGVLAHVELRVDRPQSEPAPPPQSLSPGDAANTQDSSTWGKVARNAPCPCGSGKKFKACHGRVE